MHAREKAVRSTAGDEARYFGVPGDFWRDFVKRHWNRKPVVFRRPFAGAMGSAPEIFAGMASACDASRRMGGGLIRRVYAENTRVMTGVDDLLPRAADGSLDRYARRASAQLGERRFGVILNHYHKWDGQHWLRVRDFLRGLFERVGLPPGGVTTDVLFGTYERTPFGIGKDTKHVFTWVIDGRKRVLVWPFEALRKHYRVDPAAHAGEVGLGTQDYSGIRDEAIVLEGDPGDLMYWPPSYWHVAEASDPPSSPLTLTVTLDEAGSPMRSALARLQEMAAGTPQANGAASWYAYSPSALRKGRTRLPRRITAAHGAVRRLLESTRFESESLIAWMDWVSGSAFLNFPAQWEDRPPLRDSDLVRGDARFPILWADTGRDLECSANGHHWTMRRTRESVNALRYLASGPEGSVGELVSTVQRSSRREFRELLELLDGYLWLARRPDAARTEA